MSDREPGTGLLSVDDDDELLARLGRVIRAVDPVPDAVRLAARSAIAWRSIDTELAELAYDSQLDDAFLTGVRGSEQPRLMTFTTHEVTLEVQVALVVLARRLVGQIVPPQAARVEVRQPSGVLHASADELGRFIVDDVNAGPVSLRCELGEAKGARAIETDWVVV